MPDISETDMINRARQLLNRLGKATLSTIDRNTGYPYGSLVLMARCTDDMPLLLLSDLADHTQNILADSRVSLALDGTGSPETGHKAMTGERLTIMGKMEKMDKDKMISAFISTHPEAELYAGFTDFNCYRVIPERYHLIAGFGRIMWLDADRVMAAEAKPDHAGA